MSFLNLNTFSALSIVSGMAFQRMLPRKAREFMPKDIVLVSGICSVIFIRRSYVSSLCTKEVRCLWGFELQVGFQLIHNQESLHQSTILAHEIFRSCIF